MQGFLTPDQRAELLHELKVERHAKYSDRIKTILLLDQGITYQSIALHLFLDEGTIRNYRKRYVDGGILGLVTDTYSGKRSHLTDKEKEQLSNYLQSKICMDTKEVAAYNRSGKVKILARKLKINLFYLPPYSPNLNPIERLWKFMKKKVLYNKYYEHLSEFEAACMNFFRGIRKYRCELVTLLTDNFQILGT
jgi:transposase